MCHKEIVEKALRNAELQGATQTEVFTLTMRRRELDAMSPPSRAVSEREVIGVAVRVLVGRRLGFAGGLLTSDEDIAELVSLAVKRAREGEEVEDAFPSPRRAGSPPRTFDEQLADLDVISVLREIRDIMSGDLRCEIERCETEHGRGESSHR